MAENDMHYNGMSSGNSNNSNGNENNNNTSSGIPVIPLPEEGAGGPVYSVPDENTPVIPLPEPGAGGPVFTGGSNTGGNRPGSGSGSNRPGSGSGSGMIGGTILWPNINWIPNYPSASPQYFGQVRFLNASTNTFPVNISIDGTAYAMNSTFGTITGYDWVSDGFHTVTVRRASGLQSILLQQNIPFSSRQKVTMVLTDSASGGLELIRVIDTGCSNLPYNTGCYRFANMTYNGSRYDLLLYGGTPVFRNVGYQAVTDYKQAAANTYQFYITNASSYNVARETQVIVLGSFQQSTSAPEPLVSLQVDIAAGQNYTTYLIGNTWSDLGLRALTVTD